MKKFELYMVYVFFVIFHWNFAWSNVLDDFIKKADPTYSWKVEGVFEGIDYTTFILHLTSQTWRTSAEVNQPEWHHPLIIVRPKQVATEKVLLYVGKGTNKDFPSAADQKWVDIAVKTKSIVAEIRNVPNQPLTYLNDGQERYEDNSVAYSWNKVMTTHDPNWNIRFPMVKSIIKAMDTIDAFMASSQAGSIQIKGYVVAGESKRGWATWLAASVDHRIVAIVPMVIDVLNVQKFLQHHYEAYGFWSPAIKDYVNHNIVQKFQSTQFSELMHFEDPYYYRDRITVPKYMINASGDQFFLPDSSQFYFGDLIGPKYLRYLPNTDHSMRESDAFDCLSSFYSYIIKETEIPKISWSMKDDGSMVVVTHEDPIKALLWSASNPNSRDFRLGTIGKGFQSVTLERSKYGTFIARVQSPMKGFTAFFAELTFKGGLTLTTQIKVVPDTLPFKDQLPQLH